MPSFRYELDDADVADLVSFVRDKCCWDPENPPLNPQLSRCRQSPTFEADQGNVRGGPWGFVRSAGGVTATAIRGGVQAAVAADAARRHHGATSGPAIQHHDHGLHRRERHDMNSPNCSPAPTRCGSQGRWNSGPTRSRQFAISGPRSKLDDIVLGAVSRMASSCRPTGISRRSLPAPKWSGNLDGTAQEKRTFSYGCGSGCHTYGQILRETALTRRSWRVDRHQDDAQHRLAAPVPGGARTAFRRRSRTPS